MQPILTNFAEKRARGVRFSEEQVKYVRDAAKTLEMKKVELEQRNEELKEIQKIFNTQNEAQVIVKGEVYPGTTIVIGDISTVIQSNYHYCRFEAVDGDVKMVPM